MGMKIHLETRKIEQIFKKIEISQKKSECKYLWHYSIVFSQMLEKITP